MSEDPQTDRQACRPCWQNCGVQPDAEMRAIDRMEDDIAPLQGRAAQIRNLITGFEACYHEADKEAQRIVKAIGAGRCPRASHARPPKRKRELQNSHRVLLYWCHDPGASALNLCVGGIPAKELLGFIGQASPLKVWQVQRVVEKIGAALNSSRPYHNLVLNVGDYGEAGATAAAEHYKNDAAFLEQTKKAFICDTVEGRQAKISLAMAIDLLMPCHWDFVGGLVTILKAIGGDLHPQRPYTCCARNLQMSPLCDRLRTISGALSAYWSSEKPTGETDRRIAASLGAATPAKRWLAASLDKTIRLQLQSTCDFWLTFFGT